jgi:galactitol-specific phosphotransferase system IIC component
LVGLSSVSSFLGETVLGFLPRVIVAAFILIIASVLAEALSKTVVAGSKTVNMKSSGLLGTIAKYAVWIFAFILALEQLGISSDYIKMFFGAFVYTFAIALALAFGLGGKEHAARILSKLSDDVRKE